MRNIDGSSYLKNPELEIVRTNADRSTVGAAFVLYADQAGAPAEPEGGAQKPKKRLASGG
jgi:hypothetical protein